VSVLKAISVGPISETEISTLFKITARIRAFYSKIAQTNPFSEKLPTCEDMSLEWKCVATPEHIEIASRSFSNWKSRIRTSDFPCELVKPIIKELPLWWVWKTLKSHSEISIWYRCPGLPPPTYAPCRPLWKCIIHVCDVGRVPLCRGPLQCPIAVASATVALATGRIL
jgi:hypothetical protein